MPNAGPKSIRSTICMVQERRSVAALLRVLFAALLALLGASSSLTSVAAERSVLVLHSQHMGFPVSDGIGQGIIHSAREAGYSASEIQTEFLDLIRYPTAENRRLVSDLMTHRLSGKTIDIVFAEGSPALEFSLQEGAKLFPRAVLVSNVPDLDADLALGERKLIHFPWAPDSLGTARLILRALPETRRLIVVVGSSPADKPYERLANATLAPLQPQLEIVYTSGMSYQATLDLVRSAGSGTVVLYVIFFGDSEGRASIPIEVGREVINASKVPVFATAEAFIKMGIVGGSMLRTDVFGREIGQIARDYIDGRLTLTDDITRIEPSRFPMFHWDQIKRWTIDPANLPPDSLYIDRPPNFWEQYQLQAIAVIVAFITMTLLLLALTVQSRRRREAELEARANEARHRILTEAAPEAILVLDMDSRLVLDANANTFRLLGCKRHELIGNPLYRFYRDEQPDGMTLQESIRLYMERARQGEIVAVERVLVRPSDGEEIHCDVRMVMLPADPARAPQIRISLTDITERKAIESALYFVAQHEDSNGLTAELVTEMLNLLCRLCSFDHAVFAHQTDTGALNILSAVYDGEVIRLDKEASDWIAKLAAMPQHGDIWVQAHSARGQLPANPLLEKWSAESFGRAVLRDAETQDMGLIMLTSRRALPHPERSQSVLRIIALRAAKELEGKRAAERVWNYSKELERQVAARTSELAHANEDLARARDAAEEATRAKSNFLANMSHEIRTPMNAIIGMSTLALRLDLEAKARDYVQKVHNSASSLLGIINDILDFSKIEAGKLVLEQHPFAIDQVMEYLANVISLRANAKNIELHFKFAPTLPEVLIGDSMRLGQVLINLGNNAVKFSEDGDIVFGVEPLLLTEDQVDTHFWVSDNGIGMSPEQAATVFQSFTQADASTSRRFGGTGLGLAISSRIVEAMGGTIWVESELGEGSTFHFRVPFGIGTPADASGRMALADELKGLRILVVDDNRLACEVVTEIGGQAGMRVEQAHSGAEALEMIESAFREDQAYQLVLMDWKMPNMSGLDCTAEISARYGPRSPPIVVMTAYGEDEVQREADARSIDFRACIHKPVTPSTLLETIGDAVYFTNRGAANATQRYNDAIVPYDHLSGLKVLLVEDNELNQELAGELLSAAGIEVSLAENGAVALEMLAQNDQYDGILMDCQMPVMDGYEATRRIRSNPSWRDLPVIAMTANVLASDRKLAADAGMNDHIAKPLDIEQMFACIARWMAPAAVNATYPAQPDSLAPQPALPPLTGTEAEDRPDVLTLDALPTLPGIDRARGLQRCMGKLPLYRNQLTRFSTALRRFESEFVQALTAQDPEAATRIAHTLKGSSASIGALALASAAAELEAACTSGEDKVRIDTLLQSLLQQLHVVAKGLAQLDAADPDPPAAHLADPTPETLLNLRKLIDDSDVEALALAESLHLQAMGHPLEAELRAIHLALSDFEFERASVIVTNLIQR